MDIKAGLRTVAGTLSKHSPTILTVLGIAGFGTTCVMVAKAAPKVKPIHAWESAARKEAMEDDIPEEERKEAIVESVKTEFKEVLPLYGPPVAVGVASVACFVAANKINLDRQAALVAAYSLSAETLAKYQSKVIEKIGQEVHSDILDETTKEIADAHATVDPTKEVMPEGTVRVYDGVTGNYFYCSRERIYFAAAEINRKLVNEVVVPLREFYYAMGVNDRFELADILGWDVTGGYDGVGDALEVFFGPHLDDDKNPCLMISYKYDVLRRGRRA